MYKKHHPKSDMIGYMKKGKEGASYKLQQTYKAEKINTAEYLNTKHKDDQFVNIVKFKKAINQI